MGAQGKGQISLAKDRSRRPHGVCMATPLPRSARSVVRGAPMPGASLLRVLLLWWDLGLCLFNYSPRVTLPWGHETRTLKGERPNQGE